MALRRTTDDQIAEWRSMYGRHVTTNKILDALETERARADASEARGLEDDFVHIINQLGEARAWAAWFAAESAWHAEQVTWWKIEWERALAYSGRVRDWAEWFTAKANHLSRECDRAWMTAEHETLRADASDTQLKQAQDIAAWFTAKADWLQIRCNKIDTLQSAAAREAQRMRDRYEAEFKNTCREQLRAETAEARIDAMQGHSQRVTALEGVLTELRTYLDGVQSAHDNDYAEYPDIRFMQRILNRALLEGGRGGA